MITRRAASAISSKRRPGPAPGQCPSFVDRPSDLLLYWAIIIVVMEDVWISD
jgi:hypothetical protein